MSCFLAKLKLFFVYFFCYAEKRDYFCGLNVIYYSKLFYKNWYYENTVIVYKPRSRGGRPIGNGGVRMAVCIYNVPFSIK